MLATLSRCHPTVTGAEGHAYQSLTHDDIDNEDVAVSSVMLLSCSGHRS